MRRIQTFFFLFFIIKLPPCASTNRQSIEHTTQIYSEYIEFLDFHLYRFSAICLPRHCRSFVLRVHEYTRMYIRVYCVHRFGTLIVFFFEEEILSFIGSAFVHVVFVFICVYLYIETFGKRNDSKK